MKNGDENDLPNYDPGVVNHVIRILGELGWLEGNQIQIVDSEQLGVSYSLKGHQSMKKLAMELKECLPVLFNDPPVRSNPDASSLIFNDARSKVFLSKAHLLFPELFSRIQPGPERSAIIALIIVYEKMDTPGAIEDGLSGRIPPGI